MINKYADTDISAIGQNWTIILVNQFIVWTLVTIHGCMLVAPPASLQIMADHGREASEE